MIVLCDVDGVIADLHRPWYKLYNDATGDMLQPEDVASWSTHHYAKYGERVYDFLYAPELYFYVEPVSGSQEGIQRFLNLGYRVVFVSSCVDHMVDPKVGWLKRYGFLRSVGRSYNDFIAANDKTLICGDVLIEDALHNAVAWTETQRRRAVVFRRPWNEHVDIQSSKAMWIRWADSWEDIVSEVTRL